MHLKLNWIYSSKWRKLVNLINDFFPLLPHTWVEAKDFIPTLSQSPAVNRNRYKKQRPNLTTMIAIRILWFDDKWFALALTTRLTWKNWNLFEPKAPCEKFFLWLPVVMHRVYHWLPIPCCLWSKVWFFHNNNISPKFPAPHKQTSIRTNISDN